MATVHEQLDTLRVTLGACRLAAFIDLRSQLVLSSSAAHKPPQETLDTLAENADLALPVAKNTDAEPLAAALPHDEVLILTQYETTVYMRSRADSAEALCCICAPEQDVLALRDGVRSALKQIAETG